jgi:hypothetical protein
VGDETHDTDKRISNHRCLQGISQSRPTVHCTPRDGVIVVTVLMAFLAGMTLGGLFTGSTREPTRVAANIVPPYPGGTLLTMR